ncbi:hypothetical protein [Dyadobacter sp. 676]|uniref:Uncharacterized protein n=1 Tax=Dyadobacter sp. 676 TaxID=3088362 RepID=A0AAU8FPZ7_9BACT
MRKIASIGLLALLLYNMFGLSLAVLFFEKDYQIASSGDSSEAKVMKIYLPSLPYSGNLEITENLEGLVKRDGQFYNPTHVLHENDTLYVTLRSNEAARDRFFELANAMQVLNDPHTDIPQSPYGKAVELLGNLLKIYIPNNFKFPARSDDIIREGQPFGNRFVTVRYSSFKTPLASPPPECRQAII